MEIFMGTPLNILISPANKGDFSSENDGFSPKKWPT
jgi:hypothetical protein